jgi:carbonic anhydrase
MSMEIPEFNQGHQQFLRRFETERALFHSIATQGQHPVALWIGCCDSRVVPEFLVGAKPGELFVVRDIANIIPLPGTEASVIGAAIEYAVLHLGVKHIIVCGHTQCGGIHALEAELDPAREPYLIRLLSFANLVREQVMASGVPAEQVLLEMIKANVLLQCEHLRLYPCVRQEQSAGNLFVHAWYYDLSSGQILAYQPDTKQWETLPDA